MSSEYTCFLHDHPRQGSGSSSNVPLNMSGYPLRPGSVNLGSPVNFTIPSQQPSCKHRYHLKHHHKKIDLLYLLLCTLACNLLLLETGLLQDLLLFQDHIFWGLMVRCYFHLEWSLIMAGILIRYLLV